MVPDDDAQLTSSSQIVPLPDAMLWSSIVVSMPAYPIMMQMLFIVVRDESATSSHTVPHGDSKSGRTSNRPAVTPFDTVTSLSRISVLPDTTSQS
jgi:hypothetical protein